MGGKRIPYFDELVEVLGNLPIDEIERTVEMLKATREQRHQVFLFGNGGSAATASHLANDLAKLTIEGDLPRLRVIALTDNVPLMTAWANDTAYEAVFAEQLDNLVSPGDLVIGISTSGTSPNVVRAMELAKARGAVTVALTGQAGGALKNLAHICVMVPSRNTQLIEDVHLAVGHSVVTALRQRAEKHPQIMP